MLNRSMRQATPSELGKAGNVPPAMRMPMHAATGATDAAAAANAQMNNSMILNPADTPNIDNSNASNWSLMEAKQEPWSPAFLNGLGMETSTSTPNSQSTFVSGENALTGGFGMPLSSSGELPLWLQETNLGDLELTNTGTEAFFLPSEDFSNFALL